MQNLRNELRLMKAAIVSSHNYGTDDGMKSVIVVDAPLAFSVAKELGFELLFTPNGAPRSDIKSFVPEGKLESLKVEFPLGDNDLATLIPEQVASIRVKKVDDVGYVLSMRIHVLNNPLEVVAIHDRKRKSEFPLVLRPAQARIEFQEATTAADAEPPKKAEDAAETEGNPFGEVHREPFSMKKLSAEILIGDVSGGFAAGWTAEFKARHRKMLSEPLGINSPTFASETEARSHAALQLGVFVREAKAVPRSDEEIASLDALMTWLGPKGDWTKPPTPTGSTAAGVTH